MTFWSRSGGISRPPRTPRRGWRAPVRLARVVRGVGRVRRLGGGPLLFLDQAGRHLDVQRRQLLEARQAEALEELEAGAVQERPAGRLRPAQLDDEAPVEQRADRVVRVDAADPLHRRLGHGLAVGDDRERLERGRREADGVDADVAGDQRAGVGRRDELDAVARQHEPDPAIGQRDLEVAEALVDGRAIDAGERRDLPPGQRALRDEQEGLELGLGELLGDRARIDVQVGLRRRLGRRIGPLLDHANDSRPSSSGASGSARRRRAPPPSSRGRRSAPTARPASRRSRAASSARASRGTSPRRRPGPGRPRSRSWSTIDAGAARGPPG